MNVILTKQQVYNIYKTTDEALAAPEPSGVRVMMGYTGPLIVNWAVEKLAKRSTGFGVYAAIHGVISGTLFEYADQVNNYDCQLLKNHSKIWYDTMTNNNFSEIELQLFNLMDYYSGKVQFTKSIPNVLGYKDSAGNWVTPV